MLGVPARCADLPITGCPIKAGGPLQPVSHGVLLRVGDAWSTLENWFWFWPVFVIEMVRLRAMEDAGAEEVNLDRPYICRLIVCGSRPLRPRRSCATA
jgi:hypothetical protein